MRRYHLLTIDDVIPNEHYEAIVNCPYPSPNDNPRIEWVYYCDGYWCGTKNHIVAIIEDSVIKVLKKHNPNRAKEIILGGCFDDGKFNNLFKEALIERRFANGGL